jgi:nitronate monooxygenase
VFTGVYGNYLKGSIVRAGLDPAQLGQSDKSKMDLSAMQSAGSKAWKDIWGAGQSVAGIQSVMSAQAIVDQLAVEYESARRALAGT